MTPRDYLTYHLLQELVTSVPSVRQLTCLWMLTGPDRTGHGNVSFVKNDELPALSDFLASSLTRGERRACLLRTYFAEQQTTYRPHGDEGPPFFCGKTRAAYFDSIPSADLSNATVFVIDESRFDEHQWQEGTSEGLSSCPGATTS